ncbi:hypothetical protein LINGRAHAP2_LOCUS7137 [Linum grandiflorum]
MSFSSWRQHPSYYSSYSPANSTAMHRTRKRTI